MRSVKEAMLLYGVSDRSWVGKQSLTQQIESALKGGITCLQLREKDLGTEDFLAEALEIKTLCQQYHTPFIVNDNLEIAIRCGADGIHIGQSDRTASEVRALIGDKMILGVSAQTVAQAVQAVQDGADYLGVGAVFATSTKQDAKPVDLHTLKEICATVTIPVVAIGGITKENIAELYGSGIDGIALVSAIFSVEDIQKECEELHQSAIQLIQSNTKEIHQ